MLMLKLFKIKCTVIHFMVYFNYTQCDGLWYEMWFLYAFVNQWSVMVTDAFYEDGHKDKECDRRLKSD